MNRIEVMNVLKSKKDFKIALVGDSGVGKTYQCRIICNDNKLTLPTKLVDVHVYQDKIGNRYRIWELGGSTNCPEEFYESFFKDSKIGAILWNKDPSNIEHWRSFIKSYCPNIPIFDIKSIDELVGILNNIE